VRPRWGKLGQRPAAPRSRAGKLALFAIAGAALGYVCARLIVLLADVRPYIGWYLPLAVAVGIVVVVAVPWIIVRGFRRSTRWPGLLLAVYTGALVAGMRYYLSLRFTPHSVPAVRSPPPLWFVLEIAGLAAVAFIVAAITLLILVVAVEVIAPGSTGRWLRARLPRRADRTVLVRLQ
jgi:branched-subunit amino acid ABC-type transport system permease component